MLLDYVDLIESTLKDLKTLKDLSGMISKADDIIDYQELLTCYTKLYNKLQTNIHEFYYNPIKKIKVVEENGLLVVKHG